MKHTKLTIVIILLLIFQKTLSTNNTGSIDFKIPSVETKHKHQLSFDKETLKFFLSIQKDLRKNGPTFKDCNLRDIIISAKKGIEVASKFNKIIEDIPKKTFYGITSLLFTTGGLTFVGFGIYQASKYQENENLSKSELFFKRGILSTLTGILCLCISYKNFQVTLSSNSIELSARY